MTRPMTVEELFESSGGGAPIFFNKNSTIGEFVEGEVVDAKAREARDFENPSVIKTWDDGSPQMQLIITLQTSLRDRSIDDDDGKRRVFLRWYGSDKNEVETAVAKAGDRFVKIGAWMRVTFAGLGEPPRANLNPPRIYTVQYRAASSVETLMTKDDRDMAFSPNFGKGGTPADRQDVLRPGGQPPADRYQADTRSPARQALDQHADEIASGAVSAARETQRSAAQDGGDRRAQIEKVQKLARAGFQADEIASMVTISREGIEAILLTV